MDYHDVLAIVGAGSAHPGGFATTLAWLKHVDITSEMHVLDIGCGTGRTLTELQRRYQCRATGVDIRPAMIRKAKSRAKRLGIQANWKVASAESLPFPDNQFDFILTESVNVFVDAEKSLHEYHRVLKPYGSYVDVEMMLLGPVPDDFVSNASAVYGTRQVPDLRGWKNLFQSAGFESVRVLSTHSVRPEDGLASDQRYPDTVSLADVHAYRDPMVLEILRQNANWLEQNHQSLGYGLFLCRRGE